MNKEKKILPEGWKEVQLGDIGIFRSGTGFSEKEQGGKKGIPFYKVSDMNLLGNENTMKFSNNFVTEEQILRLKYNVINNSSIIFAKVGAAIFLERKRIANDFLIDNNMMAFIPKDKINFVKYLFDSIKLSKYVQTGALPSYNASGLSSIKISIPPIEEQERIAEVLSSADSVIELTISKISKLKLQKKSLMQKLLTLKPHWVEKRLGDVTTFLSGYSFNSNKFITTGIPLIRISNITQSGLKFSLGSAFLPEEYLSKYSRFKALNNDLIIAMSGATTGKMCVKNDTKDMLLNQRVGIIRVLDTTSQSFINQYLFTHKNKILRMSYGGAQPNVSGEDIKKIKIIIPPSIKEQEEIAEVLKTQDAVISLNEQKLQNLKLQKKSLMQKLLTGEWRI